MMSVSHKSGHIIGVIEGLAMRIPDLSEGNKKAIAEAIEEVKELAELAHKYEGLR